MKKQKQFNTESAENAEEEEESVLKKQKHFNAESAENAEEEEELVLKKQKQFNAESAENAEEGRMLLHSALMLSLRSQRSLRCILLDVLSPYVACGE